MNVLNHMTDSQLKTYSGNFDKYKDKALQLADDKYGPQIDELNEGFIKKVEEQLNQLPGMAEAQGHNTVSGFITGLKNMEGDLSEAVTGFTDNIIKTIQEGLDIHSPSKETESLGEYTAKGFMNGLTAEDMSGAVDNFTSAFIAKLAEKDPLIRAAMENTFTGNLSAVLGNMESVAAASLSSVASALSGKIPMLPDVTKLSLPSFEDISGAVNGSGTAEISAKLDKLDTIISLIQTISVIFSNGQTIKLQIELDGALTADMDRLTAIIAQKLNNISIQTGKQVFSY